MAKTQHLITKLTNKNTGEMVNMEKKQVYQKNEHKKEEDRIRNWIRKSSQEQSRTEKLLVVVSASIAIFSIINLVLIISEILKF